MKAIEQRFRITTKGSGNRNTVSDHVNPRYSGNALKVSPMKAPFIKECYFAFP